MDIGLSTFNSLKNLLGDIAVKFGVEAKLNETEDSKVNYGYYKIAVQETDTFGMYTKFPIDVIRSTGIATNETLIETYASNPKTIPREYQQSVLEKNREYVINNFVEENNYYRKLMGLPNIDDYEFIYVEESVAIDNGISFMTPIHELTEYEIILLDSIGYIDKMIDENPTKQYLKFLGSNKIDLILARDSLNFAILRLPKEIDTVVYESFVTIYNKARDYFGRMIFNEQFAKKYDMYEGFIGLCLLTASVQQLSAFAYKNNIYREFFDSATIKAFFDCYNMPFFKDIPLDRQRILVKNINKLLHVKSTNQVIYEICSILGFESIEIYQYYLIKEHRLDENGIPRDDKMTTSDGVVVPNYEQMYNLYFHPINLKDENPTLSFLESENRIGYDEVVSLDPYWFDDNEVRNEIYETNFNYTETKYLSISTMYRLTKMMFEITHFYRIIQDNKKYTKLIDMTLPKLFGNEIFSFFDVAVFSLALISKRMGFNGEIVDTPTKVMSIYGFDFSKDYHTIEEMINNDKYLLARKKEIMHYIKFNPISEPSDLNSLYADVRDLHMYLKDQIASTKDLHEYRSLKNFYKAVLVMKDTNEMFRMKNGQIASTMGEYLKSSAPLLGNFLDNVDNDVNLNTAISHVILRFETLLGELKYLSILSEMGSTMFKALMQLIRFFKSYTVDIASVAMTYMLDDRDEQMVKILDNMKSIVTSAPVQDTSLMTLYSDFLSMKANIMTNDKLNLTAKFEYSSNLTAEESVRFKFAADAFTMFMELRSPMLETLFEDSLFIESLHEVEAKISSVQKYIEHQIKNSYDDTFSIEDLLSLETFDKLSFKDLLVDILSIQATDELTTHMSKRKDALISGILNFISAEDNSKYVDEIVTSVNTLFELDVKNKFELASILNRELNDGIKLEYGVDVKYWTGNKYDEYNKFIYTIGYFIEKIVKSKMDIRGKLSSVINMWVDANSYSKDDINLILSVLKDDDKMKFISTYSTTIGKDVLTHVKYANTDRLKYDKELLVGDLINLVYPTIDEIKAMIFIDERRDIGHLISNFIKETYTSDYLKYKQRLLTDSELSLKTKRSFSEKTWRDFMFYIRNNVNIPIIIEELKSYDELKDYTESYEVVLVDTVFKTKDNAITLHDSIIKS